MHVAAYMLIATRLSHKHCQVMQHRKSRCDMLIIGTCLLQHRSATNTDILLHAKCDIVCCLALQPSTPCCNLIVTITWTNLELGATCCNAHMKFALVGVDFVAIVTPPQIVSTAAAADAHTASLKSHHARVPPAIGVSYCALPLGFEQRFVLKQGAQRCVLKQGTQRCVLKQGTPSTHMAYSGLNPMRTLHAGATRTSGSDVEYSHGTL
jgi:hypothetical protein